MLLLLLLPLSWPLSPVAAAGVWHRLMLLPLQVGAPGNWQHIIKQIGMFSYTGERPATRLMSQQHSTAWLGMCFIMLINHRPNRPASTACNIRCEVTSNLQSSRLPQPCAVSRLVKRRP
jgi:hypothetical protein